MKKILILLAAICLCGCSNTDVTKEEPMQNIELKYYYQDSSQSLYTTEIEGHLYVIYGGNHRGGIIHAEHCPCKMK